MSILSGLAWFGVWVAVPAIALLMNGVAFFGVYVLLSRREWDTIIVILTSILCFGAIILDLLIVGFLTGW